MLFYLNLKYTLIIWISSFLLIFSQSDSLSLHKEGVLLEEVVLESFQLRMQDQRDYLLLKRKVLKVYPYVDSIGVLLSEADLSINSFNKKRKTRRYIRRFQKKIMNRFANNISNLTRQEGVILSKLIHREFNITAYDLIASYRGVVHAFFWQRISRLYEGNLKSTYSPDYNREDFYIEHILNQELKE
ncbi:MAG: hypothetical protein CMP50_01810 [Flavobacteriales bacterium]|nr:hypothetical protein [Flavobacteriales bacterium]